MAGILILIILTICYWLTPLVLIIVGLSKLKSKPEKAKSLFIMAAVMLVIGGGVCGALLV